MYVHLTRCGGETSQGPCEGPAHLWEQSRVYSPPEERWVEQGAACLVAPEAELVARGYDGSDDPTPFLRWMEAGAPGALPREWDERRGEYVVSLPRPDAVPAVFVLVDRLCDLGVSRVSLADPYDLADAAMDHSTDPAVAALAQEIGLATLLDADGQRRYTTGEEPVWAALGHAAD